LQLCIHNVASRFIGALCSDRSGDLLGDRATHASSKQQVREQGGKKNE
jgi:hypothetical protein